MHRFVQLPRTISIFVDIYLTLFRDASEDLIVWEQAHTPANAQRLPVPQYTHGIVDFAGLQVTSSSGSSVLEMAGSARDVPSYGKGSGALYLLQAPVSRSRAASRCCVRAKLR